LAVFSGFGSICGGGLYVHYFLLKFVLTFSGLWSGFAWRKAAFAALQVLLQLVDALYSQFPPHVKV
jgi:hypothetical protein